jgi:hypothetical protein
MASRAAQAIFAAGLICGVLDGLSAIAITLLLGGKIVRMFQGIAGGILGPATFQKGSGTAVLAGVYKISASFRASCSCAMALQAMTGMT